MPRARRGTQGIPEDPTELLSTCLTALSSFLFDAALQEIFHLAFNLWLDGR